MSLKILCLGINRYNGIRASTDYSSYFESEIIHIYNKKDIQFHVYVKHLFTSGMLVKIVTLGVKYKITKLIYFDSTKELVNYLNKSL